MQSGGLLRDYTVSETVQFMASLFANSRREAEVLGGVSCRRFVFVEKITDRALGADRRRPSRRPLMVALVGI